MASKDKKKDIPEESSFREELSRRFKANPLLFIGTILVLVIVIVAFVFVPAIVPEAGRGVDLVFGSYNKAPISYVPGNYLARVEESLTRENQSIAQYYHLQIWREAFDETATHLGILDEMKQVGYIAPAEVVDRRIAEDPSLLAGYRQADKIAKLSLWQEVQEGIAEGYYRSDLYGYKVPSAEAAFIGAMASRERKFDLVGLSFSSYPGEEVTAYGKENQGLFRVTKLSRITKSSEKEAEQVLGTIRGEVSTFEDAAKTYSEDGYADQGGDMGTRYAYELATEIPGEADREKVIGLKKGEISSLIEVPAGWAFFRAEEDPAPADITDAAVLEKIRSYILGFERGRIEDWLIKDAGTLADRIRELGLDDALAERSLEKKSFGPAPLNYGDMDLFIRVTSFGNEVPELFLAADSEKFWQAAFSTPLKSPSEPLVLGSTVAILYPQEETVNTGEDSAAAAAERDYSSYQLATIINRSIRAYFINNGKLEDRFEETYNRFFLPAAN